MSGVQVAWPSLKAAWRKAQYEELWFQFRPDGNGDAYAAVEAAVLAANQWAGVNGHSDDAFAEGVSGADKGPVALMSRASTDDGVRGWLDAFAAHLGAAGWSGKIAGAPQHWGPDWLTGADPLPPFQLVAYVSYAVHDPTGSRGGQWTTRWNVAHAATREIASAAVEWTYIDGAEVYLTRNLSSLRTTSADIAEPLALGVERFGMAGVMQVRSNPARQMRSVRLTYQGQTCCVLLDETRTWQDRLALVTKIMTSGPVADIDLGIVRYGSPLAISWSDLPIGLDLPGGLPVQYRVSEYKHLHKAWVPDAHGVQVLTDEHLAKATDLSDWTVTPLAGGRHLVEAPDLEPWYANPTPDPGVLAKARLDFGAMIMTPDVIAQNPPPQLAT